MSTDAGASSSSHTILKKITYDVFISFRGEDTRPNFTSHLHTALCRAKIKSFIDEDDLEKGSEISPTLLKAIEESRLCIIVLSEDYASSRWCLEELEHILRCKKTDGQAEVLPVFYNVNRSDVQKVHGSYKVAFAKLEERFEEEKLQAWREALMRVANLPGWASNEFRFESNLIDTIVDVVIKKLNDSSVSRDDCLQGLVGVTERIEQIESLLHIGSLDVHSIGVWGTGGVGKTTLARVVFYRLSSQFEACCFLENVREESKKRGPDHFKNKLFHELLKVRIHSVTLQFEKDRLRRKKVLIVFDDVDDPEQLEHLYNASWFGPGSRIIITSRDKQVLRNIGVRRTFKVERLDYFLALELFSLHAFKKSSPTADKDELSRRIAKYAGGVPLALIVLGRHVYSKSIKEWQSTLDKLQKIPDKKIQSVLRISYDSLEETEKDIFLDIAFFFKGENRDRIKEILNGCDLFATAGISVLIDKALLIVSQDSNMIWMHDLIQMMAFEIARPQSTNQDPKIGSRIGTGDDFYHALKNDRGIENITGISLDTSIFNREISLLPTTFSKMCELRLLKITGGKLCLPHGPLIFPNALKYLEWHSYPLKSLSTNFTAEMLVALDMRGSQLEKLWEGAPHLDNLKRVDLSGSMYLTQVPDLSLSPNLESITLQYCVRLIEAPSYIEHLEKLKELSFIGCPSLCKLSALPRNLRTLKVLTGPIQLDQTNCSCSNNITWYPSFEFSSKLERFPIIPELIKSIRTLKLDFAAIKELPSSISNLSGLKTLSLKFCQNLEFLPDSIHCLRSLRKLKIAFCRNLKSLPILPSSSLIFLDATCCASLKTMSNSVTSIKQNWDDLHNRRYKWEEFKFWGCGMLDENAHNALMDEALFRILRLATLVNKYGLYHNALDEDEGDTLARVYNKIFWSESKIPRWFSHKSEESSICMNLPHPDQWYNNSYLGLAACVIVEFDDLSTTKPISLEVYWESVYTFPNGDSWSQRRVVQFDLSYEYHVHGIRECCTTLFEDLIREDLHYDSVNNSKHVFLFMDNTYGEFLISDNGKLDANGNKFPRAATLDFDYFSEEWSEYLKADEETFDANGNNATATFSFDLSEESKGFAKLNKCGVHFLYTQEAERFGFVEQTNNDDGESESSKDESIHSESDQEESKESLPNHSESDQEESKEPLPKRIRT